MYTGNICCNGYFIYADGDIPHQTMKIFLRQTIHKLRSADALVMGTFLQKGPNKLDAELTIRS